MRIKITADSTCDLTQELLAQHNIAITPLYIISGDKAHRDGVDITPPELFARSEQNGEVFSTSAVSAADYYACWSQLLEQYDAIIHISLSSAISSSYQNACLAAGELGSVFPVDSKNLCGGSGLLAIEAAELAERGLSPEEIADRLRTRAEQLEVSFVLDTLSYLRRGGRCSAMAALGGNLLGIKPCIEMKDGVLIPGTRYRGKLDRVALNYLQDRLANRDDIDGRRLVIADSGISDELRNVLTQAARELLPTAQILHLRAGCTISSHCGPGCFALMYFTR